MQQHTATKPTQRHGNMQPTHETQWQPQRSSHDTQPNTQWLWNRNSLTAVCSNPPGNTVTAWRKQEHCNIQWQSSDKPATNYGWGPMGCRQEHSMLCDGVVSVYSCTFLLYSYCIYLPWSKYSPLRCQISLLPTRDCLHSRTHTWEQGVIAMVWAQYIRRDEEEGWNRDEEEGWREGWKGWKVLNDANIRWEYDKGNVICHSWLFTVNMGQHSSTFSSSSFFLAYLSISWNHCFRIIEWLKIRSIITPQWCHVRLSNSASNGNAPDQLYPTVEMITAKKRRWEKCSSSLAFGSHTEPQFHLTPSHTVAPFEAFCLVT
jgi:hypothetical protein